MSGPFKVVELRRYALHPGQREALVELFEERFIEPQEELGMSLLGQFRDLHDPEGFVWLRDFAICPDADRNSPPSTMAPSERYRDRANATMINSDNVLLLRTPSAQAAVNVPKRDPAAEDRARGVVAAVIAPVADAHRALQLFEQEIASTAVAPRGSPRRACGRCASGTGSPYGGSGTAAQRSRGRRATRRRAWPPHARGASRRPAARQAPQGAHGRARAR